MTVRAGGPPNVQLLNTFAHRFWTVLEISDAYGMCPLTVNIHITLVVPYTCNHPICHGARIGMKHACYVVDSG